MTRSSLASLIPITTLLVAVTGCPGSEEASASAEACTRFVSALVGHAEKCGSEIVPSSERARVEYICEKSLTAPGTGSVASQVEACTARLASAACGDNAACEDLTGELVDGTACALDHQCKSGWCSRDGESACGTCAPRVAIGGSCDGARCVAGAKCVYDDKKPTCIARKVAQAGESCAAPEAECAAGLRCIEETCRAPSAAGGPCRLSLDCTGDLSCVDAVCADPPAEGAKCTPLMDRPCASGLACDGTCKKPVTVKIGESCDPVRRCERGRCVGLRMAMTRDDADIEPGTCVEPLADGAACSNASEQSSPGCDYGAACIDGKCTLPDPATCK